MRSKKPAPIEINVATDRRPRQEELVLRVVSLSLFYSVGEALQSGRVACTRTVIQWSTRETFLIVRLGRWRGP